MSVEILDHELQEIYETAIEAAKKAGEMIQRGFEQKKVVDTKEGAADLVTETDLAVEKTVHEMIKAKYQNHKFIGEETVSESNEKLQLTDDPTWIIDPIDGTTNFVHTVPDVSFSLGVTVNKKTVIGIVYAPIRNEMFTARLGQGSFLNGKQLKANHVTDMKNSLGIVESGSSRDPAVLRDKIKNTHSVVEKSHGVRAYGSAALDLCYVAAGRGDFYFEYGIHIWDFIAGALIATEAGAVVLDPAGGELDLMRRRVMCTCTPELASQLSPILIHLDMGFD